MEANRLGVFPATPLSPSIGIWGNVYFRRSYRHGVRSRIRHTVQDGRPERLCDRFQWRAERVFAPETKRPHAPGEIPRHERAQHRRLRGRVAWGEAVRLRIGKKRSVG